MVKEEGEKPGGMTVHEALMDRKMQAFFDFLEEKSEDLKDLSFGEKEAEYLRSRGVAEELIENHIKLQERISEIRARSEREEAEARDKLVRQGVIEPGQKLTLPATLILGMVEARRKSTY